MRWFRVLASSLVLGCASTGGPAAGDAPRGNAEAASSPTVECRPVDTSIAPEILTYDEGGVRVHTFVAPEHSAGSASHVVETNDALVVIDTQLFRGYAEQFASYVEGLGKPISHVIISHGHPDHYFGLEYFEEHPTYALPETRLDMQQRHAFHLRMHREGEAECDAVTDRVRHPAHDLSLGEAVIGGVTFIFENAKDAEDNDQLVVRIPQAKTIILQDLMATTVHGFTAAGMIPHWIEVLRGYQADDELTHVLSGHGRPVGPEGIGEMIAYLEASQRIYDTVETGEELLAAMKEAFPDRDGFYLVELVAKMKYGGEE